MSFFTHRAVAALALRSLLRRASALLAILFFSTAPMFAFGAGVLRATQAITSLSSEFGGPIAFGISVVMIVASAIAWFVNHHQWTAIGSGLAGVVFISGIALGSTSVLAMVGGAAGALV